MPALPPVPAHLRNERSQHRLQMSPNLRIDNFYNALRFALQAAMSDPIEAYWMMRRAGPHLPGTPVPSAKAACQRMALGKSTALCVAVSGTATLHLALDEPQLAGGMLVISTLAPQHRLEEPLRNGATDAVQFSPYPMTQHAPVLRLSNLEDPAFAHIDADSDNLVFRAERLPYEPRRFLILANCYYRLAPNPRDSLLQAEPRPYPDFALTYHRQLYVFIGI